MKVLEEGYKGVIVDAGGRIKKECATAEESKGQWAGEFGMLKDPTRYFHHMKGKGVSRG